METLIDLLKEIKNYSEWIDRDSVDDLKIYLDTIRELANDGIEILNENKK